MKERGKKASQGRKMRVPPFPVLSFRAKREIFLAHRSDKKCEGSGKHCTSSDLEGRTSSYVRFSCLQERSLGCARDDETRGRTVVHFLSSRCESQPPPLRGTSFQRKEGEVQDPFPPWGRQRNENTAAPHQSLPLEGKVPRRGG